MATAIRLKRGGRTHNPYYRVVVMDSRQPTSGRVLDEIGIYHPCARPEPRIEVDAEKALSWLKKGAQPSDTVRSIFSKMGIMKALATGAALEPAPAAAAVEETSEAPAEA